MRLERGSLVGKALAFLGHWSSRHRKLNVLNWRNCKSLCLENRIRGKIISVERKVGQIIKGLITGQRPFQDV